MQAFLKTTDKKTREQTEFSALLLSVKGNEYDFCGDVGMKRLAASYLHNRYCVPMDQLKDCVPVPPKELPFKYHGHIDALYVDDMERKIHMVVRENGLILADVLERVEFLQNRAMAMMQGDGFYDYSKLAERYQGAIDNGYCVEMVMLSIINSDTLCTVTKNAKEELDSPYFTFDIITPKRLAEIFGLRMAKVDGGFDVARRDA